MEKGRIKEASLRKGIPMALDFEQFMLPFFKTISAKSRAMPNTTGVG